MTADPNTGQVALTLRTSIGLLARRLRQVPGDGELALPERAALIRLDRSGPATSSALARLEQISPQSMGATLSGLETRGLVQRNPDPGDGRRVMLSVTDAGRQLLRSRRDAKTRLLARALATDFSREEQDLLRAAAPLLERLAQCL
jgi:DNA-binding MarR family transcriptional regulator